jgi:peptidoglycan/LPS O-acetylase OafA/YrhL
MLGTFRYLLASMVVLTHLWPAQSPWWGVYAVFCFYLVSGYLMTLVLSETYAYTSDGLGRFAANRILRIYPAYLAVCVIALGVIHLLPEAAASTNPKLHWPASAGDWISSLVILGQLGSDQALIPPAWSLHIELCYYALMASVLARHRTIITGWFVVSCAYHIWLLSSAPLDFSARYNTLLGASLPFSLGAMLYAYRASLLRLPSWTGWVSGVLFLGNVSIAAWSPTARPILQSYYLSLLFGALLLVSLARIRPADVPPWFARLDRVGGHLSYPMFLCHYPVGVGVVWLGFGGVFERNSALLWGVSFALTHVVAWAIYLSTDRNSDRLRERVRQRRSARALAHE